MSSDLRSVAIAYHRALPDRIRVYLNGRGVPDTLIQLHQLGWDGRRITIPIFNREGALVFFKFAKDPESAIPGPKMLTSHGACVELYGWERILAKPCRLIICEGEFDRFVLEAHGFAAVTSTGGAATFRPDWASEISSIPDVFLCFDRDDAGRRGAGRVGQLLPRARIVTLPEEVGQGGDITDYFVRLGRTRDDFERLLATAAPVPPAPAALPVRASRLGARSPSGFRNRIAAVKATVPIAEVAERYILLRSSGANLRGRCLFHEDHDPSFVVYPESSRFHCFGCGQHGDVITLFMAMERVPFRQALDALEGLAHDHEQPRAAAA